MTTHHTVDEIAGVIHEMLKKVIYMQQNSLTDDEKEYNMDDIRALAAQIANDHGE